MPQIRLVASKDFERFAKALKDAADSKALLRETRSKIRAASKPAVAAVKSAVTNLPVRGMAGGGAKTREEYKPGKRKRPGGLRATIARAVGVQVVMRGRSAGVRLRIRASALPPDQRKLPRYLNSRAGWRHPVFGDRDIWVDQYGKPYWEVTILRYTAAMRRAVADAIDAVIKKLN